MTSVYFARCGEQIKIGIASNVKSRITSLQVASPQPIELLGAVRGTAHDERALHERLAPHRVSGEWFSDCQQVREAMRHALDAGDFSDPAVARRKCNGNFGKAWKGIFPIKAAEELAARTGSSVRAAAYQLSGECEPSAKSLLALIEACVPRNK